MLENSNEMPHKCGMSRFQGSPFWITEKGVYRPGNAGLLTRLIFRQHKKFQNFNCPDGTIKICSVALSYFYQTEDGWFVQGNNSQGQLGIGDKSMAYLHKPINISHPVINVSCGVNHTFFQTTVGLFSCGLNDKGQLGLGDTINRNIPTLVENFNCLAIRNINCDSVCTFITTDDGGLYVTGQNFAGCLALGSHNYSEEYIYTRHGPIYTKFLKSKIELDVSCVHTSYLGSTVLNTTNGIYVCGRNERKSLCNVDERFIIDPLKIDQQPENIVGIHLLIGATIYTTKNEIFITGIKGVGQLGFEFSIDNAAPTGDSTNDEIIDVKIPYEQLFPEKFLYSESGVDHLIIHTEGKIYGYGSNENGKLGFDKSVKQVRALTEIPFPYTILDHNTFHKGPKSARNTL